MITKDDYQLMKELIKEYESGNKSNTDGPYIVNYYVEVSKSYNKNFGDDKECECGHSYYRHFDTYENMEACGCKYCGCGHFKLTQSEKRDEKLTKLGI